MLDWFSVLHGKLIAVLIVHLRATSIPNSAHRMCHQENATVLRFHCCMWLKQILTLLGNFTSTYTSWILCIDFFGPRKYFTVCTSFSIFSCCKMLFLILHFSKAEITGWLHMGVLVCCSSSLQSTSPGNNYYRMIWLEKSMFH